MIVTQMRANLHRLAAVIIALALGIGFLAGTMLFSDVLDVSFRHAVTRDFRPLDVIVTAQSGPLDDRLIDDLRAVDGVEDVQPQSLAVLSTGTDASSSSFTATEVPATPRLADAFELEEGRLPKAAGELAMTDSALRMVGGRVGKPLALPVADDNGQFTTATRSFTVVGILGDGTPYGTESWDAVMMPSDLAALVPNLSYTTIPVSAATGVSEQELGDRIDAMIGDRGAVQTAEAASQDQLYEYKGIMSIIRLGTGGFAVIALIVAAMAVSNTLGILIAQRTREIALQRCSGATAAQVRCSMMIEAMVLGVMGSVAGIVLAWGAASVTLAIVSRREGLDVMPSHVGLSISVILLSLLAGLVTTSGAAWLPALSATRIPRLPRFGLHSCQCPPREAGKSGRWWGCSCSSLVPSSSGSEH